MSFVEFKTERTDYVPCEMNGEREVPERHGSFIDKKRQELRERKKERGEERERKRRMLMGGG